MKLGSGYYKQRILFIRLLLVIVVAACLMLMVSVYERIVLEREMAARRAALETERAELLERKVELEKSVEYLTTEASVEAEIRKHFDVAREGEQVIILVDEPTTEDTSAKSKVVAPLPKWYQFWRW